MLLQLVPVVGVSKGIVPGENGVWVRGSQDATDDRELARTVAEYPLSNIKLLSAADQCRPPQSWYDEDHEGLY